MEVLVSGFIQAILSGAILLFLTKAVEKNSKDAQRATEAEKKIIEREISEMTIRLTSFEQKHDSLVVAFQSLREKVILMVQKQDDFQTRLFELIKSVENFKTHSDHGRVLKK